MSENLQDIFKEIRLQEERARSNMLASGLISTMLNLEMFLNEDDPDDVLDYLEQGVDINTLLSHRSSFPDHVLPLLDTLENTYKTLKDGSIDLQQLAETIRETMNNSSHSVPDQSDPR